MTKEPYHEFCIIRKNILVATYSIQELKEMMLYRMIGTATFYSPLNNVIRITRTLRLFNSKGFNCVSCGLNGTVVKEFEGPDGPYVCIYGIRYVKDRYKYILMTADHIRPKTFGGSNGLKNLQPMCEECNRKKGSIVSVKTDYYCDFTIMR